MMNNNNKRNGNSRLNTTNGQSSDDDGNRAGRSNNVSLFDIDNNDTGEQENRNEDNDNEMDEDPAPTAPRRSVIRRFSIMSTDDEEWRASNPEWLESSGDSSSNQENNRTEENKKKSSPAPPKVLSIPKPKHNWFVVKEVLKREMGEFRSPTSFSKRFYGSLHAVQRLELMYKLERHSGCVNAINFNKSGTTLISGSDDRSVAIWNWMEGKCLSTFATGHTSNVFQCKFLPYNDGHIVTCSRDGQVRLALRNSTGTYESSESLAQHTRACHKISVINQEPYLVISAGADGQVFEMDIREKKPKRLLFVKERSKKVSLYSVHVNPATGNEFCVSGEDYYVRIYDRRYINRVGSSCVKFAPTHLEKPFAVYVTCAVFNYNGTEVMGSYNDDDIYLFDAKHASGSQYVHRYEGHRNSETVKGVNFFGPKSEYVVSGSDCGNIYFWDKNTEAIVQWMRGDEEGVINCLEPHPKIPVLATSGLDSDVKIWVPSCEQEPSMDGLSKIVNQNIKKRNMRGNGSRNSLNDTLVRWWRQMRYLHRHEQSLRDGAPIFIEIGSLGAFGRFGDYVDSSNSGSSSDSSTSILSIISSSDDSDDD